MITVKIKVEMITFFAALTTSVIYAYSLSRIKNYPTWFYAFLGVVWGIIVAYAVYIDTI